MMAASELLELVTDLVMEKCNLDTSVSLEELPSEGGLYAELGEGFTETQYYGDGRVKMIPVLFLCRHADQRRGMEELEEISSYLEGLTEYPDGKLFSWLDAETAKEPNKIGRDENGMYHFSCIVNCKIFC